MQSPKGVILRKSNLFTVNNYDSFKPHIEGFSFSSPLQVEVFDVWGELVLIESFSTQKFELNIRLVGPGIYAVRLLSANYSVVEQIIIQ